MKENLFKILYFGICSFCSLCSNGQIVSTIAGSGVRGYSGNGGQAFSTQMANPWDVMLDNAKNVYVLEHDNSCLRKIDPLGTITLFAGTGISGFSGDGGLAINAMIRLPWGEAIDKKGNIYISDYGNNRIRKVRTNGVIITIVGTGIAGYTGDGGLATSANIYGPTGLVVDSIGNLYFSDCWNNCIRKVDTLGLITTIVGNGSPGISPDGTLASAALIYQPGGLTFNSSGELCFAETASNCVRKISSTGYLKTLAGSCSLSSGFSGDGGLATNASLNYPSNIVFNSYHELYISDGLNYVIRKVDSLNIISTFAGTGACGFNGDGGLALATELCSYGISIDANGNLYLANTYNNRVRKIDVHNTVNINPITNSYNGITVSPNPSSGIFEIKTEEEPLIFQLFNDLGQVVQDLSQYSDGIYLLKGSTNKNFYQKKIVKQ